MDPPSLLEHLKRPSDQDAWRSFVELYTPLLFYWLRKVGVQEANAADLIQEVLVVLFHQLPEFVYDRAGSFRNWLRTVTLNKLREIRRRRRPLLGASLPEVADEDELTALEETEYRCQLVRQALVLLKPEFSPTAWSRSSSTW